MVLPPGPSENYTFGMGRSDNYSGLVGMLYRRVRQFSCPMVYVCVVWYINVMVLRSGDVLESIQYIGDQGVE